MIPSAMKASHLRQPQRGEGCSVFPSGRTHRADRRRRRGYQCHGCSRQGVVGLCACRSWIPSGCLPVWELSKAVAA